MPIEIDQQQSVKLIYDIKNLEDTAQIKRVAGDTVETEYPVDDVSQFDHLQFIESRFAAANRVDADEELIDRTICEVIPYYLEQEGIQLPDDSRAAARVKCLILKQVRRINSDEEIVRYLADKPYTTQLFDPGANCINVSPSTYSGVRDQYGIDRRPVQNSIRRIRHMLLRNGILLDTLSDAGYAAGQAIPQGKKIPDQLRYRALINYIDVLLEQLTDGISFGRSGETYSIREIISAIANVSIEKNTEKRQNIAQLRYHDDIITFGQIRNIIYRNIAEENFLKSRQNLERIIAELHRNLFKFAADKVGFFSKPVNIAIDPTWVSIEKGMNYQRTPGAMGNSELESSGGFKFATGVSFGPMSRFSLGVNLVTDKSTLTDIYRRMLQVLEEFIDIKWMLADREFDDPETIEFARFKTDDTWIIRLRDHKGVINKREYEKLKEDGKGRITVGDTQVNAFYKNISSLDSDSSDGLGTEHIFQRSDGDNKFILISGQPLSETNISYLGEVYSKRWSVETHIRQLKHDFIPEIPGYYAFDHLFFLNISSIFYNIYKIINQSLSPIYGLPLRPKPYEVLLALVESTFQPRF